jgi:hypothetical protein
MNEAVEAGNQDQVNEQNQEQEGKVIGIPDGYNTENKENETVENQEQDRSFETNQDQEKQEMQEKEEKQEIPDGQWFLREGILGSGDRPNWLLEKYGYNVENQAKAYVDAGKKIGELNQRLGAFSGAPDKYDFSSVEDDNFKFDTQDKLFNEFVTECQNNNVSQDFALKIAGFAKQMQNESGVDLNQEKKDYGHTFANDVTHISNWIKNNVQNIDDATELTNSINKAGAIRALKNLMETNGFSIPGNEVAHVPRETLKDLKQEFAENIYDGEKLAEHPDKLKKWVDKFNKHSGSK